MAVGDIDQDGDLDLVRGNTDQPATLYLNVGGTLSAAPAWSGPAEVTRAVALGDVDGDGDLDLVRGNLSQGSTLYMNTGGTFESVPAWQGRPENTRAVALGDVDQDGDLDLVLGNSDGGSTLHLNAGGTFGGAAAWVGPSENAYAVALGDVDGDGDLDLVLGNLDRAATLYLNIGGTFATAPAWSGAVESTRAVALGDVDHDGDLDLVRGNFGQAATLYRNDGGTFTLAPTWSGAVEQTWTIDLGDVDADGHLDLVRGNADRGTTLYRGDGTGFGVAPAWTAPLEDTRAVALADVDADGDLDLVRGNFGQGTTLHLNVTSPFALAADSLGPASDARAAALADVDGDGDLDLVRGDLALGAALYLNDGTRLSAAPSWTGPAANTFAVALGDLDGDGDPDLVCGNFDQPATLFRNVGGSFGASPIWTGPIETTVAVALGDVDRDGDLDLVRGNVAQATTLYLNAGGTFGATPAWSGPVENTRAVALGDVDQDGDLDLVRGNDSGPSTLYINFEGTFGAVPVWSGPIEHTRSVALGDLDGDGDLDLVRGNLDQAATLYANTGATFASAPAWTGPVESTVSVALGDIDQDGDLDLVRGNLASPATIHRNDGGLAPAATWSVAAESTWAVALADVDQDGDADLVARGRTVRANRSPWIAGAEPARMLPGNPGHLRRLRAASVSSNVWRLEHLAVDGESDPVWIRGEYQFEGAPVWTPMQLMGSDAISGPFATSPAGIAQTIDWDITRVPFDRRDVVVRLYAYSSPRRTSGIQFEPVYTRRAGGVVPVRPELRVAPATLTFPTVTVGDSVRVGLTIANGGNRDLVVERIDAPLGVLAVPHDLPIPPGQQYVIDVTFAPAQEIAFLDPLQVHANDPAHPVLTVDLVVDVRPLAFETRLLAVAPQLPLGEAATVVVTPSPQVRIETGWLFYRARGDTAFADSARLVPQGTNFIALIPSNAITEAGVEYYVRVENSHVHLNDPAAAPLDVYFHPVAAPTQLTAAPVTDARGNVLAGQPAIVVVTLPDGARFDRGTLYYRAGGAARYDSLALEVPEVTTGRLDPTATIPADSVGARGLEYWVRVHTLTRMLTDPPQLPATSPHVVRITVERLAETLAHTANRYRTVSIPLELDLPAEAGLEALLSDQPEFGSRDVTRWRAYRWMPDVQRYLEAYDAVADVRLHPEPGRAYWLISRDAHRIDTAPQSGRSTPTDAPFPTTLEPGWNQVGNPFTFPVAWSNVRASGPSGDVTLEPPVAWNEAINAYRSEDTEWLEPFEGYWVWNPETTDIQLLVPPIETASVDIGPPAAPAAASEEPGAWRIEIAASCANARDEHNVAGVRAGASEGADRWDRTDPPAAPGTALGLAFLDDGDGKALRRAVDLRAPIAATGDPEQRGRRWVFDVEWSGGAVSAIEAELAFTGLEEVPSELDAVLIDRTLARTIDLRGQPRHSFVANERPRARAKDARFELLVGTPEFVRSGGTGVRALRTRLVAAIPNPVASATVVRFETARGGQVSVEVFDVQGRRVRTLTRETRDPGMHELAWPGVDDQGRRVAPGIYTIRLVAPGGQDTRRIVALD